MKDRPILFNAEMVRAVMDGHKTQTRRVVKPQPFEIWAASLQGPIKWPRDPNQNPVWCYTSNSGKIGIFDPNDIKCPYGVPGMKLWVRETWQDNPHHGMVFRATFAGLTRGHSWRPSIHMPRWASRITLEITDVRVERVQDITEADAIAEGVLTVRNWKTPGGAVGNFAVLWDSINANRKDKDGKLLPYSWHDNPFVWVVTFKRDTDTPRTALK